MAGASEATTRRQACTEQLGKTCLALGDAGYKPVEITLAVTEVLAARAMVTFELQHKATLNTAASIRVLAQAVRILGVALKDIIAVARSEWERGN